MVIWHPAREPDITLLNPPSIPGCRNAMPSGIAGRVSNQSKPIHGATSDSSVRRFFALLEENAKYRAPKITIKTQKRQSDGYRLLTTGIKVEFKDTSVYLNRLIRS